MRTRYIRDRPVSALGLGGASWSFRPDRDDEQSLRLIIHAVEAGVSLIDTARAYTTDDDPAHNETLLAQALKNIGVARENVVVATKGGHFRRGAEFLIDGTPTALRRDCEASLRALEVDAIDLYFLHHPDPLVPIEESVGALDELRREGKIRLVGVSNVSRDQYRRAASACVIDAVENELSPYLPMDKEFAIGLARDGVAYLAYSPLGGGRRKIEQLAEAFVHVAHERATSPEQVMLAWELALAPTVIPVIGATQTSTLMDCLTADELDLTDAEMTVLNGNQNRRGAE